jgi:SEC-C motif-containing protein
MSQSLCRCGSGLNGLDCCQPIISGEKLAKKPEALMRSRYTAFCEQNAEYLMKSLHASKRQTDDPSAFTSTFDTTQWLGLQIKKASMDAHNPNKGYVEFIAFWSPRENTMQTTSLREVKQLHENSTFVKERGQWFYLEGEMLPAIKLGRNDICWCGSGKKLKKCHM